MVNSIEFTSDFMVISTVAVIIITAKSIEFTIMPPENLVIILNIDIRSPLEMVKDHCWKVVALMSIKRIMD